MKILKKCILIFIVINLLQSFVYGKTLVFPPYGHSHGIRKATQAHLFMFLPFTRFKNPQGLAAAKMISRDDTTTENDDDEVVVYGVNSGKHQIIYNISMWGLATYGREGDGVGRFKNPKGVACDPKGNVYVADTDNNRVVHLFNPNKYVEWVKSFNGAGTNDQGLQSPSQIGLSEDGRIYVSDTKNNRIVVFDSTGKIQNKFFGNDSITFSQGPTTLAIADGTSKFSFFRKEQFIFCADKNGKRLWCIDFNGRVKKIISISEGYTAGYAAIDYYHNIWITDKNKHCILKYDNKLQLLDIFGSYGKEDNQFIEPRGIAIWKRYGQTFIAEKNGAQYYWIGTDLKRKELRTDTRKNYYIINTDLTEYSYVSFYYVKNNDTTTLIKNHFIFPGNKTIHARINKQLVLSGGLYVFRIEPTYSSHSFYHWDYPLKFVK